MKVVSIDMVLLEVSGVKAPGLCAAIAIFQIGVSLPLLIVGSAFAETVSSESSSVAFSRDRVSSVVGGSNIEGDRGQVLADAEESLNSVPSEQRANILSVLQSHRLAATRETHADLNATTWDAARDDPPCGVMVNGGTFPFRYASCDRICVFIPDNKKINSIRLLAANGHAHMKTYDEPKECSPGSTCPIGWAKFWSIPDVSENNTKICSDFKNWSSSYWRHAIISVSYE